MGRAEELFLRLKQGGAAAVRDMIETKTVEQLFLDYKRSTTPLPGNKVSDDDRKNLAKAIAGFGNSEGGVVVWGVDCRQTVGGDVPTKAVPVTNPAALGTLFDGAVGGLTLPAHEAVENLPLKEDPGTVGFVVTYVPAGLSVPYQTLQPRQEYYVRAGSGFVPVPYGVLAGMFGRTPQPNVVPLITFDQGAVAQNVPPTMRLELRVYLSNKGRGIAEDIFCIVEDVFPSGSSITYAHHSGLRRWSTKRDRRTSTTFMLEQGALLPPGAEQLLFTMVLSVSAAGNGDHLFTTTSGSRHGPGTTVTVELPGAVVDEAFAHYTCNYPSVESRLAAEKHYVALLKACLPST